ncbi:MAG: phytanoyl-CoA dioxygenase family protein [Rhodospirillaceae bacterium]|nr:phytanoyl-CoA dioxygenase family protein [Rhodospirillaceae bacterium]
MSHQYHAAAHDFAAIREICERHGFCLVKGVLNRDDLNGLLAGMRAASRVRQNSSDLLGLPELRQIYFDPRLLAIARALLGPQLVYDGESNVNFEETIGANTLNPYSRLHCDAKGMPGDITRMWRSPTDATYRAYRFGIYFQDYRHASGALKVIVGSHRGDPAGYEEAQIFTGGMESHAIGRHRIECPAVRYPLYNLPSEPGDVVVWNLRTFHSAGAKLFADNPSVAVHPKVEDDISAEAPALFAPPPGPRNALFFDYAAPCEEIDLYIKWRAWPVSSDMSGRLAKRSDDPATLRLAADNGVIMRHDGLIVALAVTLASSNGPNPIQKLTAAEYDQMTQRLHGLLRTHAEFSPHFRMFDRERFEKAANRNAAVASAVNGIVAALSVNPSAA